MFDNNGFAGVRVSWSLDEMYSSMAGSDFDKNGDGEFNTQESNELIKLAQKSMPAFNYFTHIEIDGRPYPVQQVEQLAVTFENGILDYDFFVPCRVKGAERKRFLKIAPYDHQYYAAMFFHDDQPVLIENGDNYQVEFSIGEDKDTLIYFDMIHPHAIRFSFSKK